MHTTSPAAGAMETVSPKPASFQLMVRLPSLSMEAPDSEYGVAAFACWKAILTCERRNVQPRLHDVIQVRFWPMRIPFANCRFAPQPLPLFTKPATSD